MPAMQYPTYPVRPCTRCGTEFRTAQAHAQLCDECVPKPPPKGQLGLFPPRHARGERHVIPLAE